jgi:hypothetical protein
VGYSTFYEFINIDNRFLHLNSPCKTPGVSNFANLGMSQPPPVNQPARQERPERTSPYLPLFTYQSGHLGRIDSLADICNADRSGGRFRSLKSEFGLRPVFHQKTKRVSGHLFITLLVYHLIHTIRCQLKMKGIHSSWSGLRKQLKGQGRITVSMKCHDGEIVHIRKSTRPEPRQQVIYDALGLSDYPGRTIQKVICP